jgi:asparaginyl-tRNA synthetase
MQRISIRAAREPATIGQEVRLQGWIRTRRDSKGGFSFLELNDGSSQANIQIVADAKLPNYESEVKRLAAGCSVTVEGLVQQSPAKGQSTEVLGVPPHNRALAAPHEHVRGHCPIAEPGLPIDS